jgi:hypothetical protein
MGFATYSGPVIAGTVFGGPARNVGGMKLYQYGDVPYTAFGTDVGDPVYQPVAYLPASSRIIRVSIDVMSQITSSVPDEFFCTLALLELDGEFSVNYRAGQSLGTTPINPFRAITTDVGNSASNSVANRAPAAILGAFVFPFISGTVALSGSLRIGIEYYARDPNTLRQFPTG